MSKVRDNLIRIGGGLVILCLTFYYLSTRRSTAEFAIQISGSNGEHFRGYYMLTSSGHSEKQNVNGTVPTEYVVSGSAVSVFLQKTQGDGTLMVEITRNGTMIKVAGTTVDHGSITATSD